MPTERPPQNRPSQKRPSEKTPTLGELRGPPRLRHPLNARALAWIAEGADGRRDEPLVLFQNQKGNLQLERAGTVPEDQVILELFTKSRKQQERTPRALEIPTDWDAVFLSESAVEKFVFPYYTAQRLLTAAELNRLKTAFYTREDVVGIVHKPPSRPLLLVAKAGGRLEAEEFPVGAGLEIEIAKVLE